MIDLQFNDTMTYSDVYMSGNVHTNIKILARIGDTIENIDNSNIIFESFEMIQSLSSESAIRFGTCESTCVKFSVSPDVMDLKGVMLWINLEATYLNETSSNTLPLGWFKVDSDTWDTNRTSREIVAYDLLHTALSKDMILWYTQKLTFPITLKAFRESAFTEFGISLKDNTYCNDDVELLFNPEIKELKGIDVLQTICELSGGFGRMTMNNSFEIVNLSSDVDFTYTSSQVKQFKYDDEVGKMIRGISIKNNNGGTLVPTDNSSGVWYEISDNPLIMNIPVNVLRTMARNLKPYFYGIQFKIFDGQVIGNPCIEAGDCISYTVYNYDGTVKAEIKGYIMEKTLKGIQSIMDNIVCGTSQFSYAEEVDNKYPSEGGQFENITTDSRQIKLYNCSESNLISAVQNDNLEDGTIVGTYGDVTYMTQKAVQDEFEYNEDFLCKIENLFVYRKQVVKPLSTGYSNYSYLTDHAKTQNTLIIPPTAYVKGSDNTVSSPVLSFDLGEENYQNITKIIIPYSDTVERWKSDAGDTFNGFPNLTEIEFNGNISKYASINSILSNKENIKTVRFTDATYDEWVNNGGYNILSGSYVEKLYFNNNFIIDNGSFQGSGTFICTGVNSSRIELYNVYTQPDNISNVYGGIKTPLFNNCTNLSELVFGKGFRAFSGGLTLGCPNIKIVEIQDKNAVFMGNPYGDTSVTSDVFFGCSDILFRVNEEATNLISVLESGGYSYETIKID